MSQQLLFKNLPPTTRHFIEQLETSLKGVTVTYNAEDDSHTVEHENPEVLEKINVSVGDLLLIEEDLKVTKALVKNKMFSVDQKK